jgi:CheY-like chemotaxis protein
MPKLLLADDRVEWFGALRLSLEEAGYEVVDAKNGADALKRMAEKPPPDVVLLDIGMPGMDGMEFLRQLGPSAPPVVVMTGAGMPLSEFIAFPDGQAGTRQASGPQGRRGRRQRRAGRQRAAAARRRGMLTMNLLLAQLFVANRPWGLAEFAILIIAVVAFCALVMLFARVAGFAIPQWVWQAVGIVLAAVFFIWLIKFLAANL